MPFRVWRIAGAVASTFLACTGSARTGGTSSSAPALPAEALGRFSVRFWMNQFNSLRERVALAAFREPEKGRVSRGA